MKFLSLDDVKDGATVLDQKDHVAFHDKDGRVRIGTVKFKEVRCGKKNCKKCPHKTYVYAQYRDGNQVKTKYVGVAKWL